MIPELETRTCACDCGATFRVLPSSTSRFTSQAHADQAELIPGQKKSRGLIRPTRCGRRPKEVPPGMLSAAKLALKLEVSLPAIYLWVKRGKITNEGKKGDVYFDYFRVMAELGRNP